ncbi:hypothetical protein GX586_12710 [bacterium]|nr:hypothetical protein [bacterium]
MKTSTTLVGFSKRSLRPCIESRTGFRRDLEAVCAVIGSPGNWTAVVALDLLQMMPLECLKCQKEISARVAIPHEHILIHTTHTHSSPWDAALGNTQYDASRYVGLADRIGGMIREAISNAKPACIRYGNGDVGQSLSVYRRGDAGPDLGFQTFWFGYQYHAGDDRPDASALVNEMKSRWRGHAPEYVPGGQPVWFDRPVDPKVQSLVFGDANGRTIGSIVRFSAHPHLTSACSEKLFDPDFPAWTRDAIEERLGGVCMFLLGPCCNIVPKEFVEYRVVPEKSPRPPYFGPNWAFVPVDDSKLLAETKRIGRDVAQAALKGLDGAPAMPLRRASHNAYITGVPLDPALPRTIVEVERAIAFLMPEYESFLRSGRPLIEMRLLANRLNWLEWAGKKSLGLLTDEDRETGSTPMPVSILQLNDLAVVFMHSEIATETDAALHRGHSGMNLLTVSMTGGSIEYLSTDAMLDEGGYESLSTVTARGTEPALRAFISEKLDALGAARASCP